MVESANGSQPGVAGWSDEHWRTWDEYADRVTVEVRFKTGLGAQDEDEVWLLTSFGAAWPKDWLKRQVVELASEGEGTGSFELEFRERTTEWGASASVYDAIITLAQSQASNLIWAALGVLGQRLATRLKERRAEQGEQALTDPEVREEALSAVLRLHDAPREALEIASIEVSDSNTAVAEVRDSASGTTFSVRIEIKSGRVRVARVRKIVRPDSDTPPATA